MTNVSNGAAGPGHRPDRRRESRLRSIAGRASEGVLVLLIASTVIVRLASAWPASSASIASLVVQARISPDAARLVADALADDPAPSRRKLLELQRRVLAVEQAGLAPARAAQPDEALAFEAKRLAALAFRDMRGDDQLRWIVLGMGRAVPVLLAGAIAWCGWRVWQRRVLRREGAG